MSTSRFCTRFDVPERTWWRKQARACARWRGTRAWPQPVRLSVRDAVLAAARAHPAWGHRKVWALARHDGAEVSGDGAAAAARRGPDPANRVPEGAPPHGRAPEGRVRAGGECPDKVWQLDFPEYEITTGGIWRIAAYRDYWSKYEYPAHVSPTANMHDAVTAIELAPAEAASLRGATIERA